MFASIFRWFGIRRFSGAFSQKSKPPPRARGGGQRVLNLETLPVQISLPGFDRFQRYEDRESKEGTSLEIPPFPFLPALFSGSLLTLFLRRKFRQKIEIPKEGEEKGFLTRPISRSPPPHFTVEGGKRQQASECERKGKV